MRRGPKPAHSVDQIIAAAMALADEQGFAALSLLKIARRVGLTANALYGYVSSKDELLLLLLDAACGPPPPCLPSPWREGVSAWTRALSGRYRSRSWLLDIPVRSAPVTPNLLRWMESLLTVFAGSPLPERDWLSCAMLLDGYARSAAALARDLDGPDAAQAAEMIAFLCPMLNERGFPLLSATLAAQRYDGTSAEPAIEFGLHRILDGIEVRIAAGG